MGWPLSLVWHWLRAHPAVVGFLILTAGQLVGWQSLKGERDERFDHSCKIILDERREMLNMWVSTLGSAGVEDKSIDILRRGYANLPKPADCE